MYIKNELNNCEKTHLLVEFIMRSTSHKIYKKKKKNELTQYF